MMSETVDHLVAGDGQPDGVQPVKTTVQGYW